MVSPLHIYVVARSNDVVQALKQSLDEGRYVVTANFQANDLVAWLKTHLERLDCLVVDSDSVSAGLFKKLVEQAIFIPTIVLADPDLPGLLPTGTRLDTTGLMEQTAAYHGATMAIPANNLTHLEAVIAQAIQQFIALPAESCALPSPHLPDSLPIPDLLSAQQERLTDRLKARLGYLGVYYKRNSDNFLRNMRQADREKVLNELKAGYRKIVLGYFSKDAKLNQNIDEFVNQAFFADIAVAHIVEIHMELMDEFSKQLKLEGRSEEILLDYRLTLIDVIAHLCEMYRRSIPREP